MRKLVRIGLLSALLSITSTACFFEFIRPIRTSKESLVYRRLELNVPSRVEFENGSSMILESGEDKLGKYLIITAYDFERSPSVSYISRNFDRREGVKLEVKDSVSRRDTFGTINIEMIERETNERERLNYTTFLDFALYNLIK